LKTEYFAKLIIGALYSDQQWLEQAKMEMQRLNWVIQLQSEELPFDKTDYYTREMGRELKRCFLSIEGLQSLECSVDWKFKTLEIENLLSFDGKRRINLDPGYLDFHRVVLLSGKEGPQKIYLRDGIWADLVLLKDKGGFRELAWTFPDLKDGFYNDFFMQVRAEYKAEIMLNKKLRES
jgi:hypothetical protein|tara:strand:- start:6579 stop:7115 length:537 start_codon:yes stop_codon:yes gene_type:complete